MNAGGRLAIYAAGLAVVFAGAFGASAAAVPRSVVADWDKGSTMQDHSTGNAALMDMQTPPACRSRPPG